MTNKEKDPFKLALRKKMEEKPIHSENDAEIWRKILKEVKPDVRTIYKTEYPWYAVAAGILLFLSFGLGLFLYNSDNKNNISSGTQINEKETAIQSNKVKESIQTNSLADNLTKEHIQDANSVAINSNPVPASLFNNARVIEVKNKILKHNLIDGSFVTLNEGSSIKIAESFKTQRNLILEGEGYFEVQADKSKPFTVYFSDCKLVVVGTKFNIRNIRNEKVKEITVTEGIVRVFDNKNPEGIEVKRGEQLKLSHGEESVLQVIETEKYISWKIGSLDFKNSRLEDIVMVLSRNFDQEIILADQIKNCKFTGDLSGLGIEEALKIISSSTSLKVEKINNKLNITGSRCD